MLGLSQVTCPEWAIALVEVWVVYGHNAGKRCWVNQLWVFGEEPGFKRELSHALFMPAEIFGKQYRFDNKKDGTLFRVLKYCISIFACMLEKVLRSIEGGYLFPQSMLVNEIGGSRSTFSSWWLPMFKHELKGSAYECVHSDHVAFSKEDPNRSIKLSYGGIPFWQVES
jgi:hypothetical protein